MPTFRLKYTLDNSSLAVCGVMLSVEWVEHKLVRELPASCWPTSSDDFDATIQAAFPEIENARKAALARTFTNKKKTERALKKYDASQRRIQVVSKSTGKIYIIETKTNGDVTCSCPAFRFHKMNPCKHIVAWRKSDSFTQFQEELSEQDDKTCDDVMRKYLGTERYSAWRTKYWK